MSQNGIQGSVHKIGINRLPFAFPIAERAGLDLLIPKVAVVDRSFGSVIMPMPMLIFMIVGMGVGGFRGQPTLRLLGQGMSHQ